MSESSEAPQIQIPPTSVDGNNVESEEIAEVVTTKVQTPKRTPSKRKSFVERAQAESEQLLKSMGINIEGGTPGRRTRSGGARSSPVVHVESPAKRAKSTTPKGKGRGKKLLDKIVVEKDEEEDPIQENSIESQKEDVATVTEEKENPEEDKVDSVEVVPEEEEVQKQEEEQSDAVVTEQEEKSQETPVEAMEVDSTPTIITTPPEPEVPEIVESAVAEPASEEEIKEADEAKEINAAEENELNTAEEIKQNENNVSSEESKVNDVLLPEDGTNNHVSQPEEESGPVEQTETSGHCQIETEPPAANSDIVQTPQSCN
ncbi:hypothetical protein ACFFRR_000822 [Megaselia abdita]